jgi:hypothetical protein
LKTKYALTALGLGAVVALLLAGVLFWQYRLDATRLSGLAFDSVEQKLVGELLARGKAMADERARQLAPAMAEHDWAGAHAIATEILDSRHVAAVELKDDIGTVVLPRPIATGLLVWQKPSCAASASLRRKQRRAPINPRGC